MKFIEDKDIDRVLDDLDTIEEAYDAAMDDFETKQPVVLGFLSKENLSILSDEERDYLEYLALVTYKTIEKICKKVPTLTEEQIGEAEEKNWEIWETAKGNDFNSKLGVFFEDYPQEDLLAFIEDSIIEDPEDPEANIEFLTDDGREPMFIALKSMIDAFHKAI